MVLGGADETLALFSFGVDSFIEVISAVSIWHMIRRIRNNQGETLDSFEQRSTAYYWWCLLHFDGRFDIDGRSQPGAATSTGDNPVGIVVSLVSMSFMWLLIHHKIRVGTVLNSPAILADAACSKACVYLSICPTCSQCWLRINRHRQPRRPRRY